jgi:hypothetical protein
MQTHTLKIIPIELKMNTEQSQQDTDNRVIERVIEHTMTFLKYQLEILTPSEESAKLNEYLYSAPGTSSETIIDKLFESNTRCEKYTLELQTQVVAMFEKKIAKINQSRERIQNTIKQKKSNIANDRIQNEADTANEERTLSMVQRLPDDLVKYIFAFVYTQPLRLILYRQTPIQIESIIAKLKQQNFKLYLKNLSKRTRAISKMIYAVAEKKGFIKFEDYVHLKNITGGQTKTELTSQIKKLINCYEYIYNIIQHKPECNELTKRIAKELLHIYQSNIYIARPQFNQRKKTRK